MVNQSIKLPSSTQSICKLEEFIQCIAAKYSICEQKFPDILISLTEAVNNAIFHGNGGNESKYVHVITQISNSGISFIVEDEGEGFNPHSIPDPTRPEHLDCCGGRGVFLMKQLADEVHYLNKGNKVRIHFNA